MAGAREILFAAAKAGDLGFFKERNAGNILAKVTVYENLEGDKAPHVAARHGNTDFFLKLLWHNREILNSRNRSGDTPLHCALKCGQPELVVGFAASPMGLGGLADGFALNGEGKSPVYLAAEKGYTEAVKSLLKTRGLDTVDDPAGSTALHAAVFKKKFGIIDALLQHDPRLAERRDGNGQVPLHLAVLWNDPDLVERLLTANPHPANILNKDGISPFHLAARMQQLQIFKLFLQLSQNCYATTTDRGQNALHLAVESKKKDIEEFILRDEKLRENMMNHIDEDGNTPLHIAASNGNMQRILSGYKVQAPSFKNINGFTCSELARAHKEAKQKEKKESMQTKLLKATEDFQSGLLVMASLITTVTFTAPSNLPGGYNGDGHYQGTATLAGRAAFKVFLISDAISMVSSIITTAALILFSVISSSRQEKFYVLKVAIGSIVISIAFMLVSFIARLWVVVGSRGKCLVIVIAVGISCTPLLIGLIIRCVYRATIWYEDEE